MDTIDGMRAFLGVAQEGSFTAAGKRLGLSTRLVSKYVRQLESRLGVQLLHRTTRRVTLTEVGRAYLARCGPVVEQFDELESLVRDQHAALSGVVRLTAPTGFGSGPLVEALASFHAVHPGVVLDLRLTDRPVALVEEGFDLAIRIGRLTDSALVARKLMPMPIVIVASPAYLAEHGRPVHPAELSDHPAIVDVPYPQSRLWQFEVDGDTVEVRVGGGLHVDAPRAAVTFACMGRGVAGCPQYAVQPHLDRGELEVLFVTSAKVAVRAMYPPNRHLTARVRALIDHLAERFRTTSVIRPLS